MNESTELHCSCGRLRLRVDGPPILSVECCCNSCRAAGARLQALSAAPSILGPQGQTRFVLYRKDRVRFLQGPEQLKEFRLAPTAKTRRVVAGCCHTPVFLEFQGGHWLSLYGGLWPAGALPALDMRTMTVDLPPGTPLPDDVPNAARQSGAFMFRLLRAWIAMGLRSPKIPVNGELHA